MPREYILYHIDITGYLFFEGWMEKEADGSEGPGFE